MIDYVFVENVDYTIVWHDFKNEIVTFKRMIDYGFVENVDYTLLSKIRTQKGSGGRPLFISTVY